MNVDYSKFVNSETAQVSISRKEIIYALKTDPEFFIQFFLQDELTFPVPDFHKNIFVNMVSPSVKRFVCAIPRDHAKTTLAKLAVVWLFLFSPYRFIIYLSNTHTIAKEAAYDIRGFILSDNFIEVFGVPEIIVDRQGDGIYKFKIMVDGKEKLCVLRALGAGQQVRGINIDNKRPQCAVVDDLEDNDNIATEPLFMKLKKWFYGPFLKCLDKFDNKVIQLGNMIAPRQLLKENCESKRWNSMKYGCLLSNGLPLWPDAWSLEKLREDFNEYLEKGMLDVWFAEMMNMPIAAGRGLIRPDNIFYVPPVDPPDLEYGCITVDLAISKQTWAHRTAVVAHGWCGEYWQPVDYFMDYGVDPIDLLDKIIEFCYRWRIHVVGIESIAFQASLESIFTYICKLRGIDWIRFKPLYYAGRKPQRLSGWAAMIKKREYGIPNGDFPFTEQLINFDPKTDDNDDDLIDAASYIDQMVMDYIMEIMEKLEIIPDANVQTLESYARV